METTEGGKESEDGGGPRVKRTRQVHPRSSQAPWSIMLRKAELKRRDPREARNFRRHFRIPYEFFLELVQLAKHRKWLSLCHWLQGTWQEGSVHYTCGAQGQYDSKTVSIRYTLLLILPKMRCGTSIWLGFEMTPSTDRRPYPYPVDPYSAICDDHTILQ